MSYTPIPKNSKLDAAAIVGRKADYYILSTDAQPTPTAVELAGSEELILAETDTGSKYYWTGTYWQKYQYKGALSTHEAYVHNVLFNSYFYALSGTQTTLAVAASIGDTSIDVASVAGFAIGNVAILYTAITDSHLLVTITNIVGTVVTLDRPLDRAFVIGDNFEKVITDMAVTGTLAAPVSYKMYPPAGDFWYCTRILLAMVHSTAGDLGLFGNLATLTNGVVFRAYVGGQFFTFTNWKEASDLKADMYEVQFDARSGGGGVYGTSALGDFKAIDITIALDGDAGDYLELLIQDNLSTLVSFRVKAQGLREDNRI